MQMEREIKRLTPAEVWDPITVEAGREFSNTVRRFCQIHDDLLKSQKKIADLRTTDAHKILDDITNEMLRPIEAPQETLLRLFPQHPGDKWTKAPWKIATPDFNSVSEYKRANSLVLNELFSLDMLESRFRGVFNYENSPPEAQARQLVIALFGHVEQLQRHLQLRLQKVNALEERISALEEGKTKLNKRRKSK